MGAGWGPCTCIYQDLNKPTGTTTTTTPCGWCDKPVKTTTPERVVYCSDNCARNDGYKVYAL